MAYRQNNSNPYATDDGKNLNPFDTHSVAKQANNMQTAMKGVQKMNEWDNQYDLTGKALAARAEYKEFDDEFQITKNVKNTAVSAFTAGKELNNEYDIVNKTKQGTKTALRDARALQEEHHVVEKVAHGANFGTVAVLEANREYDIAGKAYQGTKAVGKGAYHGAVKAHEVDFFF